MQVTDPVDANTTDPGTVLHPAAIHLLRADLRCADRPVSLALWPVAQQGARFRNFSLKRGLFLIFLEVTVVGYSPGRPRLFAVPPDDRSGCR
jgi:hypothetical protein